jgi:hypothetical protein
MRGRGRGQKIGQVTRIGPQRPNDTNDSIAEIVWRNIAFYLLETNPGEAHLR